MQETDEFLRQNLETARQTMKRYADTHRRKAPVYKPGDKVMLSTENISLRRPKPKWLDKRVEPFKVIKESYKGNNSYLLDLPSDYGIHPVFHTSLLTPYIENNIEGCTQQPPPPTIIQDKNQFMVESILAWKPYYNSHQFLVKFVGYDNPVNNRWIHEGYLDHCREIVESYLSTNPPPTQTTKSRKK
jgi:hypothetical protein